MIVAYKYKLKPNCSQVAQMVNWLDLLRCHYNFCLRDRRDSYEQFTQPKLGNYCDLRTKAECCPLTCSVSKNSQLGEPYKGNKKRNAYEMQSSELPSLKQARPWYKGVHSTVLQQNLRKLDTAFKNFWFYQTYYAR
jgi:putative transposase